MTPEERHFLKEEVNKRRRIRARVEKRLNYEFNFCQALVIEAPIPERCMNQALTDSRFCARHRDDD